MQVTIVELSITSLRMITSPDFALAFDDYRKMRDEIAAVVNNLDLLDERAKACPRKISSFRAAQNGSFKSQNIKKSLGLHYLIACSAFWCLLFSAHSRNTTSSNQRLGSAFHRICGVFMENCSRPRGLESMYTKTRPKAPGKKLEGRPICSLHKKSRFLAPAKRLKLGCVLSFLEDAILNNLLLWDRACTRCTRKI